LFISHNKLKIVKETDNNSANNLLFSLSLSLSLSLDTHTTTHHNRNHVEQKQNHIWFVICIFSISDDLVSCLFEQTLTLFSLFSFKSLHFISFCLIYIFFVIRKSKRCQSDKKEKNQKIIVKCGRDCEW
jgi:hypothetical protein